VLVHDQLDTLLQSLETSLEDKCKADDVIDDSQCVGWGVAQMMTVEEAKKEEWVANCVAKAEEAIAAAGGLGAGTLTAIQQFVSEWWAANGDTLKAEVQNYQAGAYSTAGQSIDGSILWLCETAVEGGVEKAILAAEQLLADKCAATPAIADACETSGTTALDGVEVSEKSKWAGTCVTHVKDGLTLSWDKFGELKTKMEQWWAANGDSISSEISSAAEGIINQASTTGTVSKRLYSDGHALGLSRAGSAVMYATLATFGVVGLVLAVLKMRRRARRETSRDFIAVNGDESEQEKQEFELE
jgi:hypothetical protein